MLAAILFGLEETILTQCSAKEINRYKRLSIFFLVLMTLGVISFFYFFFLLTQNYISACFGSLVLSFIYFSILRFTIITINVSLHEEMTMTRMLRNYANTYRVILFSAFVFTILVPLIALINHNNFDSNLNSYKSSLNAKYKKNRLKAKQQQLNIISGDITNLKKQKHTFTQKLVKANTSMDRGLTEFEIRKIDTQLLLATIKLNSKDSVLTLENELLTKQYQSQLNKSELPFYRFHLVFKNPTSIICLLMLFFAFILIIPFYIRALVSKNLNYAKLYKEEIKNRIVNEFQLAKRDCSEILNKKYLYSKISQSIYEDSPFNNKPINLPYKKSAIKNIFDHFQKNESTISANE
jgi:hypothetical protein